MNFFSLFSALSFVSVIVYIYVGVYAYTQNRGSRIHRIFLLLCGSYAIWSFAYAFAYVSDSPQAFSFWNKISAVGWCSFSAITLYLVLLITDSRFKSSKLVNLLIFLPAAVFFYMVVFLFGADIQTPKLVSDIFYAGNFIYNTALLSLSILILFLWGLKSQNTRIKKQANILVISSAAPFLLNLLNQTILPLLGVRTFPNVGQLYAVIMILGIYIVISRYSFLKVPEKVLLEEIQDKILDMVIILDSQYEIIRISRHTLNLLGFEEQDLLHKNIDCLFDEKVVNRIKVQDPRGQEIKFENIRVLGNNGITIPINILYIPIYDDKLHDFLGSLLIMQDIRIECELKLKNELLYEKTIRDSLTNLYNYQYMMEMVKAHIDQMEENEKERALSVMMIDIDFFKKVNDTFGHLFGDHVLQTISAILDDVVGADGYAGRYGGEEFIVLLPSQDIKGAYAVGEKIRKSIESYRFDNDLKITVSIGIRQYGGETHEQFVNNADILLYQAKQNGRNQTAV